METGRREIGYDCEKGNDGRAIKSRRTERRKRGRAMGWEGKREGDRTS